MTLERPILINLIDNKESGCGLFMVIAFDKRANEENERAKCMSNLVDSIVVTQPIISAAAAAAYPSSE